MCAQATEAPYFTIMLSTDRETKNKDMTPQT